MSLYASLCPADDDDLQEWPFTKKIELTLLDQSKLEGDSKDITSVLDASLQSEECIQRPGGKPNPDFGVDKFIRLDQLRMSGYYMEDDAMFIRIQVLD